jgi:2-hydroxychromene-2-carboxylate isomerase
MQIIDRGCVRALSARRGNRGALMSLRSLLMPAVTQRLLSRDRLLKARAKAERARRARGEPHRVHYFHQVDDPYSALLAACLPALQARYDIELVAHVVGPPSDAAAPDRARLVAYSRSDAQALAAHHGLAFRDAGVQPSTALVEQAMRCLVAAAAQGRFVDAAGPLSAALWHAAAQGADSLPSAPAQPEASAAEAAAHVAAATAERQRLGHYLGATLFYGGEWYWGLDRLYHLEQRLQDLGTQRPGVSGPMFAPDADLGAAVALAHPPPIDFFFSFRSPYSAIVAPRVFELGRLTGAPVRLRYVLPMVMRGLVVPREKRMYISLDAAREAFARQVPFGRVNDPVGRPVERGLSLLPLAEAAGLGQAYVLSFMRGVWAEGLDAGSDRGLSRIAERAGLPWADACAAMKDDTWRQTAEANRVEMLGLGLWGVPSFRVRDTAVWGQDRLWAVQQALLGSDSSIATVRTLR